MRQRGKPSHIRTLIWKNYLLKKKHPVKWLLEVLVPVAFIILLGGLKTLTHDVLVPTGWSDDTAGSEVKKGLKNGQTYNLFATKSNAWDFLFAGSGNGWKDKRYFTTESTVSGLLMALSTKSYNDGIRLDQLTDEERQLCQAKVAYFGDIDLDTSSVYALPSECKNKVVPYKIAIAPDNTFTRNYFAKTVSNWYPRLSLGNATAFGTPTIPGLNETIVFYNTESDFESYLTSKYPIPDSFTLFYAQVFVSNIYDVRV